jgi:hypothetical protein
MFPIDIGMTFCATFKKRTLIIIKLK